MVSLECYTKKKKNRLFYQYSSYENNITQACDKEKNLGPDSPILSGLRFFVSLSHARATLLSHLLTELQFHHHSYINKVHSSLQMS